MSGEPTNGELGIMLKNVVEKLDVVHQELVKLNSKAQVNTEWRLKNSKALEVLIQDRENNIKRTWELLWKVGVLVIAVVLGIDKFL